MRIFFCLVIITLAVLVFLPWNDVEQEDSILVQRFQETLRNDTSLIPIVSFNIRLDAEENNEQVCSIH